jgi:hypothetical protein
MQWANSELEGELMRRLAILVFMALFAIGARAQFDTATVLGTVTDPTGAVVANCRVELRNTATAVVQTALTDGQGQFRFIGVPVGPYRLEVTAQDFDTSVANFQVQVGAHQRVDAQLKVASASTSVMATAEAAQLETDSSEHSQVVAEREIAELPLNGREYSQLVELSTGVVPSPSELAQTDAREGSFNINGLRSTFNNFLLDGLDNNQYGTSNQGFSNQVVQLSPDAVAEFQVVVNNTSAEYGHSGGATINVVTRYGTNQLHGRAWEYLRNTSLDATGFFKPDLGGKPALHRNQFGGTLGGPILKDKAFFFIDYEGYRESQSFTDTATLPTAAERGTSSAYSGYYVIDDSDNGTNLPINAPCPYAYGSHVCTSTTALVGGLLGSAYPAAGGQNYPNGEIPAAAVTPFAQAVLSYLPATTNSNTVNNYRPLHPTTDDRDKGDVKIDYDPHPNLRIFARYSQSRANSFDPGTIPGNSGGDGDGHVQVPAIDVAGGATWTISPVSVLEARFGFSRMNSGKTPVLAGGPSMQQLFGITGLPTDPQYTGGLTYQDFADGGFTNLGRQWTNPQYQKPLVWNPKVNYTRLLSHHTIKTGIEFTDIHVAQQDLHPVMGIDGYAAQISGSCYNNYASYNALAEQAVGLPVCTIANAGSTNPYGSQTAETYKMFDYADFLLGYRYEMALASPNVANIREWGWAGYVQDDWKVNARLTVNLGLRYEFFTPIAEANNLLSNYNPATNSIKLASSSDRYTVNPNTKDFGPRIGAAYSLTDKTVLRGGFGISYVHWNRTGSTYLTQNPPYGVVATRLVYPSLSTYRNTQSGYPDTPPTDPSLIDPTLHNPTEAVTQYMPANSPDTQVRSWFFGVQRDLGRNWMLDLSYVGNNGINEVIINDINQASPQATPSGQVSLQARRPNQSFGSIVGTLPWGTSDYNGLQAKLEKRFSQGVYLLESFTWSKSIDVAGQALDGCNTCGNSGNGIPSVQNIYNWQADRGISSDNRPLLNVTSLVWSLPVGRGQRFLPNLNRALNEVIGGWQMTDIFQARSGDPLTFAYSPSPYTQVSAQIPIYGENAYRPNQNGPAVAANKSYLQYFNTASFSTPTADAPFGNSPRNAVMGFAFWQLDTGLTKDFPLTGRSNLQIRAEAFNLTNHTNFSDPNTSLGTTFGQTTSSLSARQLQVAAKIVF